MRACSEESGDLLCDRVEVNVIETGSSWQAGHGAHRSHKWVDEAGPDARTNVSDWQNESGGCTLLFRHVGQGQVGLGHADG